MKLLDFYEDLYRPQKHLASSPHTVASYRYELRNLQNYYNWACRQRGQPTRPLLVEDLSDGLLSGAMAWQIANERSHPTANKLRRTIASIWRFAKRKGYVMHNPDVDKLKEHKHEPEAWTLDEFARIVEAAHKYKGRAPRKGRVGRVASGIWWPAQILLTVSTGVRISAVMAIESAHLDLTKGEVLVRAATQKHLSDQRFDLKPEVCEVIAAMEPGRNVCVFDDWPYDRTVLGWPALESHYAAILRLAGLSAGAKDKFHKLRRTFATFIAAEAGEVVAQAMLGHSSIYVTRRYLDKRQLGGPSAKKLLPAFALPAALQSRLAPSPDNAA